MRMRGLQSPAGSQAASSSLSGRKKDGGGNDGPSYGSDATLVKPGDVGVGTP